VWEQSLLLLRGDRTGNAEHLAFRTTESLGGGAGFRVIDRTEYYDEAAYLTWLASGQSLSSVSAQFVNHGHIWVFGMGGGFIGAAENLAVAATTGMRFALVDGDFAGEYSYAELRLAGRIADSVGLVVLGDMQGFGDPTSVDASIIQSFVMGEMVLSGAFLLAGDIQGFGDLTAVDASMLQSHVMGEQDIYGVLRF